ncbi:MAG TPA: hypothetical protein VKV15_03100 [Bryobacteraceae bacterium]|nr:hypothetical protein [Bryobacteraceae bacterium]
MFTNNKIMTQIQKAARKATLAAAIPATLFTAQAAHQAPSLNHQQTGNRQQSGAGYQAPARQSMPMNRSNASRPSAPSFNRQSNPTTFRQSSFRQASPNSPTMQGPSQKAPGTTKTPGTQTPGTKTPPGSGTQTSGVNTNVNRNTNINTNTNINRNSNSNGSGSGFNNGGGRRAGNGNSGYGGQGSLRNGNPGPSATNRNTNTNINQNTNININKNVNVNRARGERRIPEEHFQSHFGRSHEFRLDHGQLEAGHREFRYNGVVFGMAQPWPAAWTYTDVVYVDQIGGAYYLCNRMHPGVRVALNLGDCPTCVSQMAPSDCQSCAMSYNQAPAPDASTLQAGQSIDDVVSSLGAPQKIVDLGSKQIYLYASVKVTFIDGRLTDAE